MDQEPTIEVENLGHLGLVSSITKKYDLVNIMDRVLPKDSNRQNISHADAIMAMIYMGLGFGKGPLYLVKKYLYVIPLSLRISLNKSAPAPSIPSSASLFLK